MTKSVIIVAAGKGLRMLSDIPKQFIEINSIPILMHTISAFYNYDKTIEITVVLPEKNLSFWFYLCKRHSFNIKHEIVTGGEERFYSVKNGLEHTNGELIAIHDGVRPLVSVHTINRCFLAAERSGAAIPVLQIKESIRILDCDDSFSVERKDFVFVQTPQIFHRQIILNAYNQNFDKKFTDDASVVENIGHKISLTGGNTENIKITTLSDLKIATALML